MVGSWTSSCEVRPIHARRILRVRARSTTLALSHVARRLLSVGSFRSWCSVGGIAYGAGDSVPRLWAGPGLRGRPYAAGQPDAPTRMAKSRTLFIAALLGASGNGRERASPTSGAEPSDLPTGGAR